MTRSERVAARKPTPAWKRWALRIFIGAAALVALLLLAHGIVLLRAGKAIRRELEAINAANEPLNWEELLRADRQGHVQLAGQDPSSAEISQVYAQALARAKGWSNGEGHQLYDRLRKEGLRNDELQLLGAALQEYQDAFDLFRQASDFEGIAVVPDAKSEPDQATLDELSAAALGQVSAMRSGARLLAAKALYEAAQGHGDEAADWCIVLCRFAHAFPGDNLLSGLVRFAITSAACQTIEQVQNSGPLSVEKLSALSAAVSALEEDAPLVRILCGERISGSWHFQYGPLGKVAPKFFARPNYAEYLRLMRKVIAAARRPFPASLTEMEAVRDEYTSKSGFYSLEKLLVPALKAGLEEGAMQQARVRVVLAALAVRRARADGESFPGTLEALVPKYLHTVPLDPFTGGALQYRVDGPECVIYSVSRNGVDDSGEGTLHFSYKEPDVVIRVTR